MLKVDRTQRTLESLPEKRVIDEGLLERDLEDLIDNSPDSFFKEIGEHLLLLGRQVTVGEIGADKIDLLALDRKGRLCVFELKRGDHKLQLLQGVSYAGMVSDWDPDQVTALYQRRTGKPQEEAVDEIASFVALESIEEVNRAQRLLLVADEFDYEVLAGAKWLHESHDVDIRCFKLTWTQVEGNEFLACTCIYPHPGIASHAKPRQRRLAVTNGGTYTWEQKCGFITNAEIREAFLTEAGFAGGSQSARRPVLYYRLDGRRRFSVGGRKNGGYLWQTGRFPGDVEFWTSRVGGEAKPEPVKEGASLRMYFRTGAQFKAFKGALQELESRRQDWTAYTEASEPDDAEEVDG